MRSKLVAGTLGAVAVVAGLALPGAAVADTYTVTTASDGVAGSFRDQIAAANAHPGPDTVDFAANVGFATVDSGPNGTIPITSDLDVRGRSSAKTIIFGLNGGAPSLTLSGAAKSTMSGLHFENNLSTGVPGGAISNAGTLTLDGLLLESNRSGGEGAGGAVANSGTLNVTDSTFTKNGSGGGHGPEKGGGAIFNTGTATIERTIFSLNAATGADGGTPGDGVGGAILNTGTLSVTDSSFTNNQATGGSFGSAGSPSARVSRTSATAG